MNRTSIRTRTVPTRPNILYLVHRVPYPPDKGDRIRTFHLLKFLARHSAVHLACLADEPVHDETRSALDRYCQRVSITPVGSWSRWLRATSSLLRGRTASEGALYSRGLAARLTDWAATTRFHAAVASASSLVPYLRLDALRDVPAVVDLIDVDSQKWLDYASASRGPRAWLYRTEGTRLRRLERSISDWAQAVTVVSQAESDLYRSFCPDGPVHAVRNGVDLEYFQPNRNHKEAVQKNGAMRSRASEPGCVFVGALDYRPNVDAVCWFCEEIWPQLYLNRPEAKLVVVGRNPVAAVRRCGRIPGVQVIGPVPDVRPYVRLASVAIAPLRIARGVQNKVLEAMAMGRAVVASPQALTGIEAKPGIHVLCARTPIEWVDNIWWLWTDRSLARAFGDSGRRYVEEHHCWDKCLAPFASLLKLDATAGPTGDSPRKVVVANLSSDAVEAKSC